MYDAVIKFYKCSGNLERTPEYWQQNSYEERENLILEDIRKKRSAYILNMDQKTYRPSPNMEYMKMASFSIKDDTSIEDLLMLADVIRSSFGMTAFQISIHRDSNKAYLLFDRLNRQTGDSIYLNRSQQKLMGVLIVRMLGLPRPEGTEQWLIYFLKSAYNNNPSIFSELRDLIKHKHFTPQSYNLLKDILNYIEQRCQGIVK